ncbi:MAG: STT3 domain-containing protein, partial [Metallosphaera sp.]
MRIKGLLRSPRYDLAEILLVVSIATISILIRSLSATFPLSIQEVDSWYIFYHAVMLAQAHNNVYSVPPDVKAWFPSGFFIEKLDSLGLPLIISLVSSPFFSSYGINAVFTASLFMSVALAGLGVVATYLAISGLTRSKAGATIGALIVALSPALTYKNLIGGLPKTSWGAVLVLLSIYLLNRAIERRKPHYGALASIPLFLAEIVWGGYIYIDIGLIVAAFLAILLNRNDEVTTKSITLMTVFTSFATSLVPSSIGFLSQITQGLMMILTSMILLVDLYFTKKLDKRYPKALVLSSFAVAFMIIANVVIAVSEKVPVPSRYYAIVNPFYQTSVPIYRTIAEYIPQSLTSLLFDFGLALFISIPGMYYLFKVGNLPGLWLLVLGVVSIYGVSAQPYLFNYTAYMVAALAGLGVHFVLTRVKESKMKVPSSIFLLLIGFSLVADSGSAVLASDVPSSLITSGSPYNAPNYAWTNTLNWIRNHTDPKSVIFSWWDYGYWLEVVGNRTVIDQNNTNNITQIKLMAEIFLNNETEAANIIENYFHLYPYGDPRYTVPVYIVAYDAVTIYGDKAFIGYPTNIGGQFIGYTNSMGDIGKAMGAMTTVAGYPVNEYLNV